MRCLAILVLLSPLALADDSQPLPDTQALTWTETDGGLADRLMDGAHAFVDRKIAEAKRQRDQFWH